MRDLILCIDQHRFDKVCHSIRELEASNRHVPRSQRGVSRNLGSKDRIYCLQIEESPPWLFFNEERIRIH